MKIDPNLLRARIFHSLKSLPLQGDALEPRLLEIIICESFGAQHVGDSKYYAVMWAIPNTMPMEY